MIKGCGKGKVSNPKGGSGITLLRLARLWGRAFLKEAHNRRQLLIPLFPGAEHLRCIELKHQQFNAIGRQGQALAAHHQRCLQLAHELQDLALRRSASS